MKTQELNLQEMRDINGGLLGLFGGDGSSSGMLSLEGFLSISSTDEDGDTNNTKIHFGLGSLLGIMEND